MTPLRTMFMSAAIGSGHHQAQWAVAQAMKARGVQVIEEQVETLDYMNAVERGIGPDLYALELRYAPWLYRAFYESTDRGFIWNHVVELMFQQGQKRFREPLLNFDPQVVVSSFWAPAAVAGRLRHQERLHFLNALVVTDYRVHLHWARREVDLLCVASPETGEQMVARGIAPERVEVTGIPIAPIFQELQRANRTALRAKFGWRPDLPLILVSAGGTGIYRSLKAVLDELSGLGRRVQVLVPGAAAQDEVSEMGGAMIHRLKFTSAFPELLAAADLVVGKAGGLTVAESTALGVPMVVFDPIPGQEEHNADFLERHGAGVWVRRRTDLRRAVLRALAPDQHAGLSAGARAVGIPDAADRVARAILQRLNP